MSDQRWIPDGQGGFHLPDGGRAAPDGMGGFHILSGGGGGLGGLEILIVVIILGIQAAFLLTYGLIYGFIWGVFYLFSNFPWLTLSIMGVATFLILKRVKKKWHPGHVNGVFVGTLITAITTIPYFFVFVRIYGNNVSGPEALWPVWLSAGITFLLSYLHWPKK